ncbi:MAG: polysaccharide deacetylase family protein [Desulfarculus sp.]|nr:polysaccharide deacetylase family protein [Desulfarculus sp.]
MPLQPSDTTTRVVLKVDVDTRVGLLVGVRRLADLMAEMGVRASFYIAMGPDNSGHALKRLARPGFLQKQLKSGAASAYGLRTMLYGILLPAPIIAEAAPGLLNRLINEGHEVGLHGWDHVFWHDRVRYLDRESTARQLTMAAELFKKITGLAPASFAAPGWQVSADALEIMAGLGISHISCTRGRSPFLTMAHGRVLPLLELPTTLPTADEVLSRPEVTPANLGRWLAERVRPGELNVLTLHAEVEGRQLLPAFREFLTILLARGARFPRLLDAARAAADQPLPAEEIAWGRIPHRIGEVGFQPSALEPAG